MGIFWDKNMLNRLIYKIIDYFKQKKVLRRPHIIARYVTTTTPAESLVRLNDIWKKNTTNNINNF